jgi:hypothetical protein
MPGGWPGYIRTGDFFPPSESTIWQTVEMDSVNDKGGASMDLDSARRALMQERVDFFTDNARPHVLSYLGTWFEIENFGEIFKTVDLSNNVCKKVITQISTIYDTPPNWALAKDDGGAWKTIREQGKLDLVMPVVNQFTELCNQCLVHTSVFNGRVKWNPITPNLFRIFQDPVDPTVMVGYAYSQRAGDGGAIWHYWGIPDSNGDGKAVNMVFEAKPNSKIKILYETANPYTDPDNPGRPVLPGVLYHNRLPVVSCLDSTSGRDIVDATKMIMALESMMAWFFRVDAFQQRWIAGDVDEAMKSITGTVAGPQRYIPIRSANGENVKVGQFMSQADFDKLGAEINRKLNNFSTNHGLGAGAVEISGTPQSGFALIVRKEPLMEIRRRRIPMFRACDEELYATTCAVWNYERLNVSGDKEKLGKVPADGKPLLPPKEAGVSLSYAHYKIPMSPAEKESELLVSQVRVSMGLTTVPQIYQEMHPDLTLEECEAAVKENMELTKEIAGDFMLVIGRAQVVNLEAAATATPGAPVPGSPGAEGQAPHPGQAALLTADGKPAAPPQVLKPGEKAPEPAPGKKPEPK